MFLIIFLTVDPLTTLKLPFVIQSFLAFTTMQFQYSLLIFLAMQLTYSATPPVHKISEHCPVSNATFHKRDIRQLSFVPIFVSSAQWIQQLSKTVYDINPDFNNLYIQRCFKITSASWEVDRLTLPYNTSFSKATYVSHEFICGRRKVGPDFIVSDLYMRTDFFLGVITVCYNGRSTRIFITDFYYFILYKSTDWKEEIWKLMQEKNETEKLLLPVPLSAVHYEYHRYEDNNICDLTQRSKIVRTESNLSALFGVYVVIVGVICLIISRKLL